MAKHQSINRVTPTVGVIVFISFLLILISGYPLLLFIFSCLVLTKVEADAHQTCPPASVPSLEVTTPLLICGVSLTNVTLFLHFS